MCELLFQSIPRALWKLINQAKVLQKDLNKGEVIVQTPVHLFFFFFFTCQINNKLSHPDLWLVSTNDAMTSDFRLRQTRDDQTVLEVGFPDAGMEAYQPDVAVGDVQEKKKRSGGGTTEDPGCKVTSGRFWQRWPTDGQLFLLRFYNVAVMSVTSTVSG